jgi:hypothetical protein
MRGRRRPEIHLSSRSAEPWIPCPLVSLAPWNDGDIFPRTALPSRAAFRVRALQDSRSLRHRRAQGMPGANAPAASRASEKSTRVSHHRFTGQHRHSLRNGFTAYSALSLVIGLSCHHPRCDLRSNRHRVDISVEMPGPRGLAVRPSLARLAKRSAATAPAPRSWRSRAAPPDWDRITRRRKGDLPVGTRRNLEGPVQPPRAASRAARTAVANSAGRNGLCKREARPTARSIAEVSE